MLKRFFKTLLVALLPSLILSIGFYIYTQMPTKPLQPRISIEKGAHLRQISQKLEAQNIIKNRWLFLIYAQLSGKGGGLKAGEYLFDTSVTPKEVLDRLWRGLVESVKVQIIEGWTLAQIANYLGELQQEFLVLSKDLVFIQSLELNVPTLEGYLFPQTYHMTPDATASEYLHTFVDEFKKNYQEALKIVSQAPSFSQHQIVTLASLVEKETGSKEERALIASVFYNRLAKNMLLQSDPTIIYGLKNFTGDIRKVDLSNPHPYNTYVHAGLPPGPICNPGLASLKAALQPATTDYIYFVSKQDGTHYFSKTAEEHAEAVKKFQLGKSETTEPKQSNE